VSSSRCNPGTWAVRREIERLDRSAIFVQGPPGAGKTYTGSHVIFALPERDKHVGVSSNSHKAIDNLLAAAEKVAAERGVRLLGVKKINRQNPETVFDGTLDYLFVGEAVAATRRSRWARGWSGACSSSGAATSTGSSGH
jgi:hypothetical protein